MQVSTLISLLALAIGSIRATPTPGVAQTAAALNAIELSSSDSVAAATSSVWLVMCIDADFKGSCVYGNNPRGKCRTSFAFPLLLPFPVILGLTTNEHPNAEGFGDYYDQFNNHVSSLEADDSCTFYS
jgi:hypothetical protein